MLSAFALHIDSLTAFGLVAVSLMLAFYELENQSRHFVLLFAGACVMGSAYGFLQGAWPFGLVEGVWSVVAVRRWRQLCITSTPTPPPAELPENVSAFLEDLLQLTSQPGPTTYAFANDEGSPCGFVQLHQPVAGRILVHRLWAASPGHGWGSHMMRTLCELADHHAVEIVLRPRPFGPKPHPLSAEELSQWYHRHGFNGSKSMLRRPVLCEIDSLIH